MQINFFQTLVKLVDFTCFSLQIIDLYKINCMLLINFVHVDCQQNIDVECRPEAENCRYRYSAFVLENLQFWESDNKSTTLYTFTPTIYKFSYQKLAYKSMTFAFGKLQTIQFKINNGRGTALV